MDVADSVLADFDALANGWVWIPASTDRIVVMADGRKREFRAPAWFGSIVQISADRERHRALYDGRFGRRGRALIRRRHTGLWAMRFGEGGRIIPLAAHAALFQVRETQEAWSLFALDGPGKITPLGTIPRPIVGFSVSRDLRRATVTGRDYRADAWLNKVLRP